MSRVRFALVLGCALIAACAAPLLEKDSPGVVEPQRLRPEAALAAVHPGDTRAQVIAALGRANVVSFASGWQGWVYRWPSGADRSPKAATEVDVLFDPSGMVRKARLRPGVRPS